MTPQGSWAMVAVLLGVPLAVLAVMFVRGRTQFMPRACAIALTMSIGFWYLLPGVAFIRDGETAAGDADLLWSAESVWHAVGVVVAGTIFLAAVIALVMRLVRWASRSGAQADLTISERRLRAVAAANLVSAAVLLVVRFREQGADFALFILTGAMSARDVLDYTNVRSASESLLGLWEIVTLFLAVVVLTLQVLRRRANTATFWGSLGAVLLLFAASGTRSIPMLALVAAAIAVLTRPDRETSRPVGFGARRAAAGLIGVAMLAGAAILLVRVSLSRFRDTDLAIVARNSLVRDNDMFRELVFVLEQGRNYPRDIGPFLATPFAFAFPRFAGFTKRPPEQLVQFNFDRAGIDIAGGAGNVFPGLFGDGVLAFGPWGPLAIAIGVGGLIVLFWSVTLWRADSPVERALFVVLLSYLFLSFRNLQGSIGILLVLCIVIRRFLTARGHVATGGERADV